MKISKLFFYEHIRSIADWKTTAESCAAKKQFFVTESYGCCTTDEQHKIRVRDFFGLSSFTRRFFSSQFLTNLFMTAIFGNLAELVNIFLIFGQYVCHSDVQLAEAAVSAPEGQKW
jgi:hypothetical protein